MNKYDFAFGNMPEEDDLVAEAFSEVAPDVYKTDIENTYVISKNPVTTEELAEEQSNALFSTVSTFAEGSLNRTFDKIGMVAQSAEVKSFIEENGLGPYLKDVNRDRVKNILAVMGMIYAGKIVKSKIGLAVLAGVGIYLVSANKDKVTDLVAKKASGIV